MLLLLEEVIGDRIQIVKAYTLEGAAFHGNGGRLQLALLNILSNAVQSIQDQGTIEIATAHILNEFHITISDTGVGINEDDLHRVYEPFFTTKAPGKGTGLGLAITFSIIQEHNGKLDIKSKVGKGTLVSIELKEREEF